MSVIDIIIPSPIAVAGTAAAETARRLAGLAINVHTFEKDADLTLYDTGSVFGLKVFMPIKLVGRGREMVAKGILNSADIKLECVIFEISQQKRVILTDVNGMDGAVVEFISNQNYQVNMQVLIGGKGRNYPLQAVQALQEWLNQPASFQVENALLNKLKIYDLVCTGYGINPSPGFENIQRFDINCVSDRATEFKLNSNV